MKFYKDTNDYYLRKILDDIELSKFTTSWVFYEWENGINVRDFFKNEKVYSFLWEYSNDFFLKKIDDWKRAFRRNKIEIPEDIKSYQKDYYLSPERKVYLDILEADFITTEKIFENFTGYNHTQRLAQIIVKNNVLFSDLNLNFLENIDSFARFEEYLKILNLDSIHAIILNGYHHGGELIKIFVHKKELKIIPNEDVLSWNIFENTFLSRPFNWKVE